MKEFTYTVKDPSGLHARPAALITNCCCKYKSDVIFTVNGRTADGKNVIALMGLYAQKGDQVTICANGTDEIEIMLQLKELLCSMEQG